MTSIFHIAQKDEWAQAKAAGSYWPAQPAGCGFIHFSFPEQLRDVLNAFFAGRTDLLLLEVEREKVEAHLRIEPAEPGGQRFPHLYRALAPHEVLREREIAPAHDGRFDPMER